MPLLWENTSSSSSTDYTTRMIESAWRRILAIAQNHLHEDRQQPSPGDSNSNTRHDSQRSSQEFYDRERRMVHALDTLFQLAYEGSGYLAFISTIISTLDSESPVAMAFLSHIIDRAALPSRETMASVSNVILDRLNKPSTRPFFSRRTTAASDWKQQCPQCGCDAAGSSSESLQQQQPSSSNTPNGKRAMGPSAVLRLNAASLWSLLAEKFAGDLCQELWHEQVGDLLLHLLADTGEDLRVRTFALIALEKFALTGPVKKAILKHPCNIRVILRAVVRECELAHQRIYLKTPYYYYSPSALSSSSTATTATNMSDVSTKSPLPSPRQKTKSSPWKHKDGIKSRLHNAWQDCKIHWDHLIHRKRQHQHHDVTLQQQLDDEKDTSSLDQDPIKRRASPIEFSSLNSFDTGFMPPEGKLRDEWTLYVQLAHCARWALDNVFADTSTSTTDSPTKLACSWDLTGLNVIMNTFDATAHWKLGGNGLELRNDRPHFESVRATACVKRGKWYYETLLLTNGIMQLGWATSRCRFIPEEGYGVGDDCNGFAFDTYRTAVWADGAAVYPQMRNKIQCRAGDVLGSFLDLDNGLCTYFINGCDLGLTVEFEHPSSRHHRFAGKSIGLGLYPAVSLTTHQHILLNFGDRPWMYPPPVSVKYKGVSEAGRLDDGYKNRILTHVHKKHQRTSAGGRSTDALLMSNTEHDDHQVMANSSSDDEEYDWDGPLCTICFSEPKNVVLLPCKHTGWGQRCADALDMCPLCRADIQDRVRTSSPVIKT
ncbi:hypothetical protein O0I10_003683 [Lichtheimia ornata]|uniref:Uncharacterized protein n=1 Tax=Lichtheimia ornata TaxID=688661 RepID=A0AAD7XZV2_9FUNG|nr:uncharacterized protein O0I10_003683 [Lichtheimia ornata]KAJ8660635.1 hypothetical protein O0I10_003683 [Lichtheimia ornata]